MRHGGYILGTNFFGSVFKKNPLLQNCIMLELFYFQEIRIYIDSSAPNLKSLLQFFVAIYKLGISGRIHPHSLLKRDFD